MKLIDLSGQRFGRLTVLKQIARPDVVINTRARWLCRCDCGNEARPDSANLRYGAAQSCGCLRRDRTIAAVRTHGMSNTPEFRAWYDMIDRCVNPQHKSYPHYGERGISVCPRWRISLHSFVHDMGLRPSSELSLDRIDNNGNYEPSNCRWATTTQQQVNRRSPQKYGFKGVRFYKHAFEAHIGFQRRTYYLGRFHTAIEAAAAYDAKAVSFLGPDARTNGVSVWERGL